MELLCKSFFPVKA